MFPGLTGKNRNETLVEMLYGILGYGLCGQLVIVLFFRKDFAFVSVGWWAGAVLAAACCYHMWWVLDRALDCQEKEAVKKVTAASSLRYAVIVVILGVVMVTKIGNPLAAVFGLLGLKAGAYLQPLVHQLCHRNVKVPRRDSERDDEDFGDKEVIS